MAIKYGFYNSISSDRKYNAEDFGKIFDGVIRDGIFESIYDKFQITILSGLSVSTGKGKAWFNSTWLENDAAYPVTFTEAEVVLDRIDAVILEFNSTESIRANTIKVITGTPSSTPQPPVLVHADGVNQYPLVYVTIPAGATSLVAGNLDIRIGTVDCPYVVVESGEIPSLTEINTLISDVAALDTEITNTVNDLAFLDKTGDGKKVLTDNGTYKSLAPVFITTLTTSGTFNPATYPEYARFIFALYGGGGAGGKSFRDVTPNPSYYELRGADGGGGGAGFKVITPSLALKNACVYTIGSAGSNGAPYSSPTNGGNTYININGTVYTANGGGHGGAPYHVNYDQPESYYGYYGGFGGDGQPSGHIGGRYDNRYGIVDGAGADSEFGVGGKNAGNATGYCAGGAGGLDNNTVGEYYGGNGAPGLMCVYGVYFDMEAV